VVRGAGKIYLILHGETALNFAGCAQGRSDSPLTHRGRSEGRALGALLRNMGLGAPAMVSSPLGRCRATAAIVSPFLDIPVDAISFDDRLDEVALGAWEGLSDAEIRRGWPAEMEGATEFDWYFRAPGGERIENVQRRLSDWLADQEIRNEELIVVGHGVASRLLRGIYADLPVAQALQLDVDRDAVFVLEARQIVKIRAD
jgi:probable phosphoglycerate mutase